MSFWVKFNKEGGFAIVGDTVLAAHFQVAGGVVDEKNLRIRYCGQKPLLIISNPAESDTLKVEKIDLTQENVSKYIRDLGYNYAGIEMPDEKPQVVFKINGDVALFESIYERFGRAEGGIEECPPRLVDQECARLKGLAIQFRRKFYQRWGDSKFVESITIV